jgi:hypothetical protein
VVYKIKLFQIHQIIATSYHQETWNPNWNLRTLVMSLRGFITTQPREIGSIRSTVDIQKKLALCSRFWCCKSCGVKHANLLNTRYNETNEELLNIKKYISNTPSTISSNLLQKKLKTPIHKSRKNKVDSLNRKNVTKKLEKHRNWMITIKNILSLFAIFTVLAFNIFSIE